MKYLTIIIALLLFSCKPNADKPAVTVDDLFREAVNEVEGLPNQVAQWITIDGQIDMPHIVLVSGDEEYRSEEAMPQLAKILSEHHGFNCTVLFAQDPEKPGIVDANHGTNIPGLEALKTADMMVLFTRFRALPDDQMKHIDDYLMTGKPVLGIRTATHAFHYKDAETSDSKYLHYANFYKGDDEWKDGFGRLVLGEHWVNHHGHHGHQSTRGITAPGADGHPILNGITDGDIWGPSDVYGVRLPLPGDSQPLVLGQVINRPGEQDENDPLLGMRSTDSEMAIEKDGKDKDGNPIKINLKDPLMPIVWTKSYQLPEGKKGQAIATTIGSSTDMLSEGVRRMMVNSVFWGLKKAVPAAANVDVVGTYEPSRFAFHDDAHWDEKNMIIATLAK